MTISENLDEQTVEELLLPVLDHLSKGDFDIPLLPHVATQVLLLANDPEGNSTQLSAVIEQDQVLASRVLQLANCAAYGPRYPIETLPQAISWLGMSFLAGTAFSFSVQTGVFKVDGYEDEVQSYGPTPWLSHYMPNSLPVAWGKIQITPFFSDCCTPLVSPM